MEAGSVPKDMFLAGGRQGCVAGTTAFWTLPAMRACPCPLMFDFRSSDTSLALPEASFITEVLRTNHSQSCLTEIGFPGLWSCYRSCYLCCMEAEATPWNQTSQAHRHGQGAQKAEATEEAAHSRLTSTSDNSGKVGKLPERSLLDFMAISITASR